MTPSVAPPFDVHANCAGPTGPGVDFAARVIAWQLTHGRHGLPWQGVRDAYPIWVSEIMLQQTQVAAVIPFYHRFMARFPDVRALAEAPLDDVLAHWSGLGYYARARNLHRAAIAVRERFAGVFPTASTDLATLPGIGRSTAAAVAAFSAGERVAILDGNVKRVLARCFAVPGFPGSVAVERVLWDLADRLLPGHGIGTYTQGLMDLGATLCTRSRPHCSACPLASDCRALAEGRVDAYPAPKPRRARPERSATLWLLHADGQILLERRPPTGIWGGLWSLPEAPPVWLDRAAPAGPGYRLRHAFTHFLLDIQVEERRLAAFPPSALQVAEDTARRWLAPRDALALGLPAPIRQVLDLVAGVNARR